MSRTLHVLFASLVCCPLTGSLVLATKPITASFVLCISFTVGLYAAEDFREIGPDWVAADVRALAVVGATASSTFMGVDGTYGPARAVDGDRHTKWVGADKPSEDSPQWITLELFGPEQLSGLALFGEAPNNDGVIAACVQVKRDAASDFVTVATVVEAPTASWLVSFDPVSATTVRVLVTRSGGPTTHTDIYEILPLGQPLSPAELRADTQQRLRVARERLETLRESRPKLSEADAPWQAALAQQTNVLDTDLKRLAENLELWDSLEPESRTTAAEDVRRLQIGLERLAERIIQIHETWPQRYSELRSAKQLAERLEPSSKAVVVREEHELRVLNDQVLVAMDERDGRWNVTWLTEPATALRGIRFSAEVDGELHQPQGVAAETTTLDDTFGHGVLIRQRWGESVEFERSLKVYDDEPVVVVTGRILNNTDHEISLGDVRLVELSVGDGGWWYAGQMFQPPGAVLVNGLSELMCHPVPRDGAAESSRTYSGTNVLAMAHHDSGNALLVGFLSAREARPDVHARFDVPQSGTALSAGLRFFGRKLPAGATLELDAIRLAAHPTIYDALERYGDAVAATSAVPVRSGATSLWCSWYAHRMAMTEELVLANAAVVARHFQPLGLEIMQLDHGWQRGDITGDWLVNERFPHGLKWLADQLKSRHGLRLGVWISPTDVAETSETFRDHPEWMLKDGQGHPAVSWQWYWKPNPNCYQLDASHPDAAAFIRDTFARLTTEGVSYYKIDFIAPCGGEHFVQHDPYCTRGWGVLRRAMEAIREGAGQEAWIRYCQTPPLLSAGLANSAYGGSDTLDAGLKGQIDVLRTNARSLAAGYWINDRLYHREVCDMSVRMQAPIEEVRLRLALMALAGCSISLSDELTYLPLSRIRMAQQVLPPGVPAMQPLDLLQRELPSEWHLPCRTEAADWDVVGLFNFEAHPETRTIELSQLGLLPKSPVVAFEFWEERLLGFVQDRLSILMPPQSSRIILLHRLSGRPQLIGTNMHVLGGWHEVQQLAWDEAQQVLSGRYRRAAGLEGRAFFYVPPPYEPRFTFPLDATAARLTNVGEGLWMQEVTFADAEFDWAIPFQRSGEK